MKHTAIDSPADSLARGAFRHQLVRRLLLEIFRGNLRYPERLRVMRLAEQYGVSSTPVRETLVELEAIGAVQFSHNRGATVKPWGPRQLAEIYQLRRILEVEATRAACGLADRSVITALRDEMRELAANDRVKNWSQREMDTDRRLHELLAASCGSERLLAEIRRYDTLVQVVRDIVGSNRAIQRQVIGEHLAILDAMLAGDADAAAEAMAEHIRHSEQAAAAAMFAGQ